MRVPGTTCFWPALAMVGVLTATPARADTIIDIVFLTASGSLRGYGAGIGGTITSDGTATIGSGIPIGEVWIEDAPMGNGGYLVTGLASASGGGTDFGSLDFNTTANVITITGCIPGLTVGVVDGSGNCTGAVTLLEGTLSFVDWNSTQSLLYILGTDIKNNDLLTAIGLSPMYVPWQFAASVLRPPGPSQSGMATVHNAVPEPGTMVLLGTGLLAAFRARRRTALVGGTGGERRSPPVFH